VKIFKRPGKTILDGSCLDEAILISMHQLKNNSLKSIFYKLCDQFDGTIQPRNWFEITNLLGIINFEDEGDIRIIYALKIYCIVLEGKT